MNYRIPYGDGELSLEIPAESVIFEGKMQNLPAIANLEEKITEALDNPIGTPPLREIAAGKKNILFLVEDATRTTPLARILPVIVEYLNNCGVPDDRVKFLTAPGTHRVMTDGEILAKLGPGIVKRFEIFQHDANAEDQLADLGTVMAGDYPVPVQVNRRLLGADFIFGLGNIVPHCDAGYSGGAKILQPGVCGFATTAATHAAAGLCPDIPLGMKNGNPCREGIEDVARRVGLSFILNTVKNCDDEVCGVFAGDFIKAHRAGCDMAEASFMVGIPEPADIVIASSHPADLDFWQASKGLASAYFAVKKGGVVIFASPCTEGLAFNHPRFREWLAMPLDEVLRELRAFAPDDREADLVSAVVAADNCRVRDRADVYMVTDGLTDEDFAALKFRRFADIREAVGEALRRKPGAKVGILPHGGISLPVIVK